jgi:hypothetical protein
MNNFIPPIKGTKLGEFKFSWFQSSFLYIFSGWFGKYILRHLFFEWGLFVILPIFLSIKFGREPFHPEWLSYIVTGILFIIGVFMAVGLLSLLILKILGKRRFTEQILGRSLSLFLVENGIEINDFFIPFKNNNYSPDSSSKEGIILFKIDDDCLLIKTETINIPFINANFELNENEIKFKLESKYQNCKDELLLYLNNLILHN